MNPNEKKPRILVVDDEEDYRIIVTEILTNAGYEVVSAGDGREGLAQLQRLAADAVLVDWMMPRMDGESFCRALRGDERLRSVPVIMLTVKQTTEEEIEALHFGVDDFLVKPFQADELLARVRAVLRRGTEPGR